MKKKLLAVILGMVLAVSVTACGKGNSLGEVLKEQQATNEERQENDPLAGGKSNSSDSSTSGFVDDGTEHDYIEVSIKELGKAKEDNLLKACNDYEKKYLQITANVVSFSQDGEWMTISDGDKNLYVECYFTNDDQRNTAMNFITGDVITVRGYLSHMGSLTELYIIDLHAGTAADLDYGKDYTDDKSAGSVTIPSEMSVNAEQIDTLELSGLYFAENGDRVMDLSMFSSVEDDTVGNITVSYGEANILYEGELIEVATNIYMISGIEDSVLISFYTEHGVTFGAMYVNGESFESFYMEEPYIS